MSFLQWEKDKLKLGKITFFKVKSFQGMFVYYFLGIPVCRYCALIQSASVFF